MVESKNVKMLKTLSKERRVLQDKFNSMKEKHWVLIKDLDDKFSKVFGELSEDEKDLIYKKIPEEEKVLKIIEKESLLVDMLPQKQIIELAEKQGIPKRKTIQALENIEYRGSIRSPRYEFYKLTSRKVI